MRILIGAVALVALAGCLDQDKRPAGLVSATEKAKGLSVASNSPDAAVKSWWSVRDAAMDLDREICLEYQRMKSPITDKLKALSTADLPAREDCFLDQLNFDRKISKVEVESDTRAVVGAVIKNITPPEPGAVLDARDRQLKEAGERYRYTLERKDASGEWKISRIENFPSYSSNWRDSYSKPEPSNNRYVYEGYQ
ncbi:hypothetical protein [Pseudomonas sp. Irchel 3A5]|uniref:hypothetical protein n=1 Tax=Pseudomonas sp. Irchel 3A5 TaxID=2008911 RepID=UPI000BA48C25|nr:hypothetical protein [Pseudomonas sp. Irchel 3A5]